MKNSNPEKKLTDKFTSYQVFVIAILAILQFTVVIDFAIISPLGDMLMKGMAIDTAQFGLLVSCYAFGAGVSGILAATFADKFDRKKILLFFYTGFLVGTFLCGLSHNYTMLLISRSVTGLFGGVISSISLAIVSDLFPLNKRGQVMGYIQMAFSASQILGIPTGLYLANHWGWNSTFLAIAFMALLIGIVIVLKLKPITEHRQLQDDKNAFERLWSVLSTKEYLTGYALVAILVSGGAMLMPFSAAFLINNVHITQDQLPLLFMFTGLANIVLIPLIGKISDKKPKQKVFLFCSVISMTMTLIYTNLSSVSFWVIIVINIIMFTGISGRMAPAMALNTAVPGQKDRGTYMSLCSSIQQMSNGIGALIAGHIVIQATKGTPLLHYNWVGYVVVALSAICLFIVYRIAGIVARNQEKDSISKLFAPERPPLQPIPAAQNIQE